MPLAAKKFMSIDGGRGEIYGKAGVMKRGRHVTKINAAEHSSGACLAASQIRSFEFLANAQIAKSTFTGILDCHHTTWLPLPSLCLQFLVPSLQSTQRRIFDAGHGTMHFLAMLEASPLRNLLLRLQASHRCQRT